MSYRILVVDDEPDWIATYRLWLEPDGYELRDAATLEGALRVAEEWRPHVAIVDKNLEGGAGRELGLSLIRRLADNFPATRTILITGFATPQSVDRAFQEGATDYLEKRDILPTLLRVKLPGLCKVAELAMDTTREKREADLRDSWAAARNETNSQRKGKLLEQTTRLLFESVPGFTHARTNPGDETEELDVIVTNQSPNLLLARQGDFLVAECKNWSSSVGTPVSSRLRDKLDKRYKRARLGIVVSMGGFAATVRQDLLAERRGEILILLFDAGDIDSWIAAGDRAQWLIERIQSAVVG